MYQKGKFKLGYIEEVGAQILELPYAQKSLSMIILLPGDAADGSVSGLEQVRQYMLWIRAGSQLSELTLGKDLNFQSFPPILISFSPPSYRLKAQSPMKI